MTAERDIDLLEELEDETMPPTAHDAAREIRSLRTQVETLREALEGNPERFRASFAGIVQGGCEACGDCDDDCPCDRIVKDLIGSIRLIQEEDAALDQDRKVEG
jgi:formate hydrogenlyase subunit 6/NADH:ubiquinone oxidoreductase subunit I